MGSEVRRRPHILTTRLYDEEEAWLMEQVMAARQVTGRFISRADFNRAVLFGRPADEIRPALPCSHKHQGCTQHHAGLVVGFREAHYSEELEHERVTGEYGGDDKLWRENGGHYTTFQTWLKSHGGQQQCP